MEAHIPVISFANPKGGSGKTTSALLLACVLAHKGAKVILIDADPQKWLTGWSCLKGKPTNIEVVTEVTEDTIVEAIESASTRAPFVIVDVEGTASLSVANAVAMSDFVVVPMQGAKMDAEGGAKTLRLIFNQSKMIRRDIAYAVLLTRTSAAIASRALRNVQDQLKANNVAAFATTLVERAAFRDVFDYGGSLYDLDRAKVSNLDKAIANAEDFAGELVARIKVEVA